MSEIRIELRTYNIGAGRGLGATGIGFGHNFLVLVEVWPDTPDCRIARGFIRSQDG